MGKRRKDDGLTMRGIVARMSAAEVAIVLQDVATRASLEMARLREECGWLAKENARLEAQVKRLSEQLDNGDDTA